MQLPFELPEDLVRRLGKDCLSLSRVALEAIALDGIRKGKLTEAQARGLLGIPSRYEMDGFLKANGLLLPLTLEEVEQDAGTALSFRVS